MGYGSYSTASKPKQYFSSVRVEGVQFISGTLTCSIIVNLVGSVSGRPESFLGWVFVAHTCLSSS